MKILNICMGAPFTEGYSYQDNLLSEYQQKHGHEVTVITTTRTRDINGKIIQTSVGRKVLKNGVTLIRLNAGNKLNQFLGYYPEVKKYIIDCCPDMIFVHGLGTLVMKQAVAYKKRHKTTLIVADNHQDEGTTYTEKFPFSMQLQFFKRMWRCWIKYVEKVYGTTSWRVRFAKTFYGIPDNKIDTLIMGVDSDALPINTEDIRKSIRKDLKIPDDAFVFITGGKLDNRKLTLEAMRAFRDIQADNVFFVIFGSVAEEIQEEFYSILKADNRFRYIGYLESKHVHRYFYASDFGIFPGRHSVLWEEAIGCGLPCLFKKYEEKDHTDVCGNCICLEKPNVESILKYMQKSIDDKNWYNCLKIKSKEAAKTFSYHAIAEKSVECFKLDF